MDKESQPQDRYLVVDSKTGEVVDRMNMPPKKRTSQEHYLKVFYSNPLFKAGLPHSARTILFALASKMPYSNSGFPLALSVAAKKKLAEEYGMSLASIDRCLPFLQKNGYLFRVGKGEYLINPHLFGKGPAASIQARREEWDTLIANGNKNASTGQETAPEEENAPA